MMTTAEVEIVNLDDTTKLRLNKILTRYTRVISRYLGILQWLETHMTHIITKKRKWSISKKNLDLYTLTTRDRSKVQFDLKDQFKRISNNELQECRDTAVGIYLSYLELRSKQKNSNPPRRNGDLIPRIMNERRCKLDLDNSKIELMDSRDTNLRLIQENLKTIKHDYLTLPIHIHDYAYDIISNAEYKGCKIDKREGRYFAQLTLDYSNLQYTVKSNQPTAILGIDLGISKTVVTSLLSSNAKGVVEWKIFHKQSMVNLYDRYSERIAFLQKRSRMRDEYRLTKTLHYRASKIGYNLQIIQELNSGIHQLIRSKYDQGIKQQILKQIQNIQSSLNSIQPKDKAHEKSLKSFMMILSELEEVIISDKIGKHQQVLKQLVKLKNKRANLKKTYLRNLCAELSEYICQLSSNYELFVVVGNPKVIRNSQYRGNGNKWLRSKVHRWSYYSLQQILRHDLAKIGLRHRLVLVNEAWTSIYCHRCSARGIRPRQSLFICKSPTCKWRGNADFNGATNIAIRGVRYLKLQQRFLKCANLIMKKNGKVKAKQMVTPTIKLKIPS